MSKFSLHVYLPYELRKHILTALVEQNIRLRSKRDFVAFFNSVVANIAGSGSPAHIYSGLALRGDESKEAVKGNDPWPAVASLADLELSEILIRKENYVIGETARRRGLRMGKRTLLGLADAVLVQNYLAQAPPDKWPEGIDKDTPKGTKILFARSLLKGEDGRLYMPCLWFDKERTWYRGYHWLGDGLDKHARLARKKRV